MFQTDNKTNFFSELSQCFEFAQMILLGSYSIIFQKQLNYEFLWIFTNRFSLYPAGSSIATRKTNKNKFINSLSCQIYWKMWISKMICRMFCANSQKNHLLLLIKVLYSKEFCILIGEGAAHQIDKNHCKITMFPQMSNSVQKIKINTLNTSQNIVFEKTLKFDRPTGLLIISRKQVFSKSWSL